MKKRFLPLFIFLLINAAICSAEAIKIMPMGDSITRGGGYPVGSLNAPTYRYYLYNLLHNEGWNVDFVGPFNGVGSSVNSLERNPYIVPKDYQNPKNVIFYDQDFAGSTGWKTDNFLKGKYEASLLVQRYTPSIVLVHLGTNDLGSRKKNPAQAVAAMAKLINQIRSTTPSIRILIAQIIPLMDNAYNRGAGEYLAVKQFNALLLYKIEEMNKTKFYPPVIPVDMWNGFDEEKLLAEKTHPNAKGDLEIAKRWFDTLINLDLTEKNWPGIKEDSPELKKLKIKLEKFKERYTDKHPDVIRTKRMIKEFQNQQNKNGGGRPN